MAFFRRTRGRRHDARKRARHAGTDVGTARTHGSGMLPQDAGDDARQGGYGMAKLPHEHDESTHGEVPLDPEPKLVQAQRDIEHGVVDTDRRSAYGLSEGPPSASRNTPRTGADPIVKYVKKKIPFESR